MEVPDRLEVVSTTKKISLDMQDILLLARYARSVLQRGVAGGAGASSGERLCLLLVSEGMPFGGCLRKSTGEDDMHLLAH